MEMWYEEEEGEGEEEEEENNSNDIRNSKNYKYDNT